jgi:hypothetical protein
VAWFSRTRTRSSTMTAWWGLSHRALPTPGPLGRHYRPAPRAGCPTSTSIRRSPGHRCRRQGGAYWPRSAGTSLCHQGLGAFRAALVLRLRALPRPHQPEVRGPTWDSVHASCVEPPASLSWLPATEPKIILREGAPVLGQLRVGEQLFAIRPGQLPFADVPRRH